MSARRALVVLLALALISVGGAALAVEEAAGWRDLLVRADRVGRSLPFTGEALWISWVDGESHVTVSSVRSGSGAFSVQPADRFRQPIAGEGSEVETREGADGGSQGGGSQGGGSQGGGSQDWLMPVPAVDAEGFAETLDDLAGKYRIEIGGSEPIMDRAATALEIHRRDDGSLRERLWVDDESGLLVRRETYDGGTHPIRLAAYLSLDLNPRNTREDREPAADRAGRSDDPAAPPPAPDETVGPRGLDALREAGWTVPDALPGGYEPSGVYVLKAGESQPLQVVYGDGLYTVSVFQQPGSPDWESLPAGAEPVEGLGWKAYEWPGAVPSRLLWEASGTTFSLVGDAPPDEFLAIAQALPRPEAPPLGSRLARGLRRLWSWVSPWS
jgi:sigma-E factor negative regulatory protein RseB